MSTIEVKVPALGDYKDVPVIDVLVKPGDAVKPEDGLVTLESDKATMDVPAPAAGTVKDLKVKVGDRVSEGSVVLLLDVAEAAGGKPAPRGGDGAAAQPAKAQQPAPAAKPAPSPAAKPPSSPEAKPAPSPPAKPAPGTARSEPRGSARPEAGATARPGGTVEVKVPALGDYKDVPVIDVLVKPGDTVKPEDGLVTLESDKATMDVPSPAAGTVKELRVKVGDRVSEGSVVVLLEGSGAPAPPADERRAPAAAEGGRPEPTPPARAGPGEERPTARPAEASPAVEGTPSARVHASPSVRRLARELGVDLGRVKGSGPKGRILQQDVQGHVKQVMQSAAGARGGTPLDLPAWPKVDFARFGPIETQPLTRIQRLSGPALARNWVMIPHVTQHDEADITALEAFRQQLNAESKGDGVKVTLLAFVVKACVAALKRFPVVNSSLEGDHLVLKRYFHVGFAADTPGGLVVPVVKDADRKGVLEIARELGELAARARDGKLQLADLQGGTFSISSLGGIGGTAFTPIINAPEVAILGVSRSATRPWWDGERFAPRLMLPLSLSYDHRVVDGALAARFITFLSQVLGDFRRAML